MVEAILRRMPDDVNHSCPQFSRTPVNFQRVPTVDAGHPAGWRCYTGRSGALIGRSGALIGISGFCKSAPDSLLLQHFGFTPDVVTVAVRQRVAVPARAARAAGIAVWLVHHGDPQGCFSGADAADGFITHFDQFEPQRWPAAGWRPGTAAAGHAPQGAAGTAQNLPPNF